jgi:hypothetical protein
MNKRTTGIKDIHGIEIKEGDYIVLSCGCCCYAIVWNEEKQYLWLR